MTNKNITTSALQKMKEEGDKISMVTAYDYPTSVLVEEANIEIILVGDSVGNTVLGYDSTIPVEVDDIIHHAKPVMKGVDRTFVVGDMPFMSFNVSREKATENAGRIVKESGVNAVKLEGGKEVTDIVNGIVTRAGIPVMGHIGLTPQRASQLGGMGAQGRNLEKAKSLIEDAIELEEAGVFSIILEAIPYQLAKLITKKVEVPTIGIGAGPYCDGQVLVFHDIVGLTSGYSPKFIKQYLDLSEEIKEALGKYREEIKGKGFPSIEDHAFSMEEEVLEQLK